MTTTTVSPPVAADVLALAGRFNVAAGTLQFGIESLFGLWSQLRSSSARHNPDVLADVSFSTVIDLVLDRRANPNPAPFDLLALIAKAKR